MSDYGYADECEIHSVKIGKEDHGIETCSIYLTGLTWGQAFGNLGFDGPTQSKDFAHSLSKVFECSIDALKGQKAIALRCFGGSGEIDALRSVATGRTFSIQAWRETRHPGEPLTDPLQREQNRLLREHDQTLRMAARMLGEAFLLQDKYRKIAGEAP